LSRALDRSAPQGYSENATTETRRRDCANDSLRIPHFRLPYYVKVAILGSSLVPEVRYRPLKVAQIPVGSLMGIVKSNGQCVSDADGDAAQFYFCFLGGTGTQMRGFVLVSLAQLADDTLTASAASTRTNNESLIIALAGKIRSLDDLRDHCVYRSMRVSGRSLVV